MAAEQEPSMLALTDTMGFIAFNETLPARERLARLQSVAEFASCLLADNGEPACTGAYMRSLEMRTWFACMPTLEAIASGARHDADISDEVLGNLKPVLKEALDCAAGNTLGNGSRAQVQGYVAEMAVLGALVWSHANLFERVRRYVLPASRTQDRSSGLGKRDGFDVILDKQDVFVPIQVKSNDRNYRKQQRHGFITKGYQQDVAVVYVSRLVDQERDSHYASLLLADSIIRDDYDELFNAVEGIDAAIKSARPCFRESETLYAA